MKNTIMANAKSHQGWSWVLIITFFILASINFTLGLLGFVCIATPLYFALRGGGKVHCAKYCPRGSFLGKFIKYISIGRKLPQFMRSRTFKNGLLVLMIMMMTLSAIHSGGNITRLGFALFRFMLLSFLVGILMGVIYKPRSWCTVCPMGHATSLIDKAQKNYNSQKKTPKNKPLFENGD